MMNQKFIQRKNRNEDQNNMYQNSTQEMRKATQITLSSLQRNFNEREKAKLLKQIKESQEEITRN